MFWGGYPEKIAQILDNDDNPASNSLDVQLGPVGSYWSSNEVEDYGDGARFYVFSVKSSYPYYSTKKSIRLVRAVRAF